MYKDRCVGLIYLIVGLVFSIWATKYRFGSTSDMGPGYFPVMLGMLLMALGASNLVKSIVTNEIKISANIAWRPLIFILLSNILFGILLPLTGVLVAIFVLVIVSSYAIINTKIKESIILASVLSISSYIIFIWALSMPLPIFPGF